MPQNLGVWGALQLLNTWTVFQFLPGQAWAQGRRRGEVHGRITSKASSRGKAPQAQSQSCLFLWKQAPREEPAAGSRVQGGCQAQLQAAHWDLEMPFPKTIPAGSESEGLLASSELGARMEEEREEKEGSE